MMPPAAAPAGTARRLVGADGIRPDGTPILTISVCRRCTARWFPPRAVCSTCAHDRLDPVEAGADGVAYASTVVRIGALGFAAPYVLTYVDVDGVRVLAHTDPADPQHPEALAPGTRVRFTAGPVGAAAGVDLWSYRVRPTGAPGSDR
ncbi:OB-fold domain-containing protein [Pseudonocardia sp. KRD-184]|uniref:OB-fold domain-containing protein n=2 Tax=Pseudonocardia oceani TaxID=2792013 RepID=A0ABS6U1W7_9PSEU|nr:OB-fold domain-containing protein [Pseudonocardia oceani]MBW0097432.1 OB-fold domain-containing protein [Pseudonocardia oceani]MBW0110093.1 OB-fold domain-containing protein [Pseudonocardia oceani]MBW0124199.1 OB-fold domain-containing protein [Pseudonocardia oceani]MBW0126246.1 OB-fold domain-containing protein [Pseudonocardia oceani]